MKLNKKRVVIAILLLLVVIALIGVSFVLYMYSPIDRKADYEEYEIEKGKTLYEVVMDLDENNFIRSDLFAKLYIKYKGYNDITAGVYSISKSDNTIKIIDTIVNELGENTEISITFKEGNTLMEYANNIEDKLGISSEEFLNEVNNTELLNELINKYWFLTDDILNENIYYKLEGYLFPNTYMFFKDSTSKDIIEKMLEETDNKLSEYKDTMLSNNLSIHEIITLASMVEGEGATIEDRKNIAGVFMNRINNGWVLGSDVTTYYGLKLHVYEKTLTNDEIFDCSNKYNTRCLTYVGLPVGPVNNPSIESIEASINPSAHNYYYFVADKNGKNYFTKNDTEHQNTINRLIREGLWYE